MPCEPSSLRGVQQALAELSALLHANAHGGNGCDGGSHGNGGDTSSGGVAGRDGEQLCTPAQSSSSSISSAVAAVEPSGTNTSTIGPSM